jgi:ubiquitin
MKKIFLLFFAITLVFWGCNKQDTILEPSSEYKSSGVASKNSVQSLQLISLPLSLRKSSEGSLFVSKRISGKRGGELELEYSDRHIEIKAHLTVPSYAFDGSKNISMQLSDAATEVNFAPSMEFSNPLQLDLEYEGVNLSGIDPKSVRFVYLNPNGQYDSVQYDNIVVDADKGILKVEGAVIPHFSRFGFCR